MTSVGSKYLQERKLREEELPLCLMELWFQEGRAKPYYFFIFASQCLVSNKGGCRSGLFLARGQNILSSGNY